MSKVAFCFPGQGSLEAGMGREIAEAVPAAMDVYRIGSEASGLDLQKLCFDSPLEELVETEVQQPALVATCLAILAAIREEGLEPDVVVGHSVGEFAALASVGGSGRARRSGSCASEASRWPRRRDSIPARWPRSSGSRTRPSRHCAGRSWASGRRTTTAPARSSSRARTRPSRSCCAEAESLGARRAIKLKVSGAFHSPLVARAADRLRLRSTTIRFADPIAPFMSTVTAQVEPAARLAALLVDQLTAPVGSRRRRASSCRTASRRSSRSGPERALAASSSGSTAASGRSPSTTWRASRRRGRPCRRERRSARSRAGRRSSPGPRAGSAARSRKSSRPRAPTVVVGYRIGPRTRQRR